MVEPMRPLARLLLPLLAALPATLDAAEPPDKPLLWKIEGEKLAEPSWLFGTIHVGDPRVVTLHPAAAKALADADAVLTEVPMDAATQMGLAKNFIRTDGKRLAESIGVELAKRLDAEIAAIQPGLDSTPFQSLKTWAVAVTVPLLEIQLQGGKPLDMVIWERAEKAGKRTGALEKPADQFGIFDDLDENEQVILLAESLRLQQEARLAERDPVAELITAYLSGDEAKVEAEMESQFNQIAEGEHKKLGDKLLKRLLDDRNRHMAEAIVARFGEHPDRSHFFAVGAGHCVGDDSIGKLLADKGYRVTRITR